MKGGCTKTAAENRLASLERGIPSALSKLPSSAILPGGTPRTRRESHRPRQRRPLLPLPLPVAAQWGLARSRGGVKDGSPRRPDRRVPHVRPSAPSMRHTTTMDPLCTSPTAALSPPTEAGGTAPTVRAASGAGVRKTFQNQTQGEGPLSTAIAARPVGLVSFWGDGA